MSLILYGRVSPLVKLSASPWGLVPSRTLTDIEYYKVVEWSHLHSWEAQSAKRKFQLKLEQRDKEQAVQSQRLHIQSNLHHPSKLEPIKLPEYVERGPTDILRALSSAVKRDYTAADYKYHDDPYLIPYNSMMKRDYIMSKDGGRRAARFVLDTHPELFEKNLIEVQPPIKSFMPKIKISDKNASLELLQSYIEGFDVKGSIEIYEYLKKKKTSVDIATKQRLLELISYHNEKEEISDNHNEAAGIAKIRPEHWLEGNMAEQIYQDITGDVNATADDKTKANLSILCGMAKHRKRKEAWIYYEMSKNVKSLDRFNAGIACAPITGDDFFADWEKPKQILMEMAAEGIKPDGITLIYLLNHIRLSSAGDNSYSNGCKVALSVLTEFKSIGILPSLAAYKELLDIFVTQNKKGLIFKQILDELEERLAKGSGSLLDFVIHPSDFEFFQRFMDKLMMRHSNLKLAYRLHGLLTKNDEHLVLLGDYDCYNQYYRSFMGIIQRREPLDVLMEYVSILVPHIWSPPHRFYLNILKEIKLQSGFHHLPRVWTDLQVGEFSSVKREVRFEIMKDVSEVLNEANVTSEDFSNLRDSFVKIASEIFNELKSTANFRQYPLSSNMSAVPICNNILAFALIMGDTVLAKEIVKFCKEEVTRLVGNINGETMSKFLDKMIETDEQKSAFECVIYSAELRLPEALEMAQKFKTSFVLEDVEKNQLNLLFSHDIEWTKL